MVFTYRVRITACRRIRWVRDTLYITHHPLFENYESTLRRGEPTEQRESKSGVRRGHEVETPCIGLSLSTWDKAPSRAP